MIKLCFKVKRSRSASLPTSPTEADPIAIDWGEIILPVTPPVAFDATVTSGSIPTAVADVYLSLQKRALDDVSEPVRKTPSHPSTGEKNGKRNPVPASAKAIVIDIPELFVINAKPKTEAMVIIGYFNCSRVVKK